MGIASLRSAWVRAAVLSVVVAATANLLLYGLGRLGGVSFSIPGRSGAPATQVSAAMVAGMSVVPLVGAWVLSGRLRRRLRALQVAAGVVAVLSMGAPLGLEADAATKVLLAAMHIVTGAAYVVAVQPFVTAPTTSTMPGPRGAVAT